MHRIPASVWGASQGRPHPEERRGTLRCNEQSSLVCRSHRPPSVGSAAIGRHNNHLHHSQGSRCNGLSRLRYPTRTLSDRMRQSPRSQPKTHRCSASPQYTDNLGILERTCRNRSHPKHLVLRQQDLRSKRCQIPMRHYMGTSAAKRCDVFGGLPLQLARPPWLFKRTARARSCRDKDRPGCRRNPHP